MSRVKSADVGAKARHDAAREHAERIQRKADKLVYRSPDDADRRRAYGEAAEAWLVAADAAEERGGFKHTIELYREQAQACLNRAAGAK